MKTPFALLRECAPALLIFLVLTAFSVAVAFGQSDARVVIKGKLIVPQGMPDPPNACLVAANGEEMDIAIRSSGKFWVNAPEHERYTLVFAQNGCFSKEVVVDAHHAAKAMKGAKDRIIEFDVALRQDESAGQLRYDGPVGNVAFHHSDGRMKVNRHYQLVKNEASELAADPSTK